MQNVTWEMPNILREINAFLGNIKNLIENI